MAFSHGNTARAYANGYKVSNYISSIETPGTADTAETTVFNSSGYKTYAAGNKDTTLSVEGFFDGSTGAVEQYFNSVLGSSAVVWTWYPSGDTLGNYGFGLRSIGTGHNISSPVDGIVSLSVEGQGSGGRDRVISLRALATATTSSTGTSVDNTAATTRGGVGYFQRTDNSTRGVTPIIQHSSAGSSWATLVTFSSGSARSGQRVEVSGTIKRYTRCKYTITGSTLVSTQIHFALNRK